MKKYYCIEFNQDFKAWHLLHPNAMSLEDANAMAFGNKNKDVIHEMWLDVLADWPEPGFFEEISKEIH